MRTNLTQTQIFMNNNKINIDFKLLSKNANNFYNKCLESTNDDLNVLKLFEITSYFESCLTNMKSLLEMQENILIEEQMKKHNFDFIKNFEANVDNLMSVLDSERTKIKDYLSRSTIINPILIKVTIKSFREKIKDYMENLIIYPLDRSVYLFSFYESKGLIETFIKKNSDVNKEMIFQYILFKELLYSSQIKGSDKRQKSSYSGVSSMTVHENNVIKPYKAPKSEQNEKNDYMDDFEEIGYDEI